MTTQYIYDMTDTWNNGATTFTFLKANVTDTASNAASLLMDLQIGSVSAFNVSKGGSLKLGLNTSGTNVAASNVTISGPQGTGSGDGGSIIFQVAPAGGTGATQNALATFLEATSARAFNLYNTTDVTTNFERAKIAWSSNVLQIGTEKGGTGTARALELQTNGTTRLTIEATSGSVRIGSNATIDASGNLTLGGFAAITGIAYYRSDMQIRNKVDSGWLTFATRDTTGAEAVYNLTNVGTVEGVSIKTAAPSGGTSGTWKLGVRVAATTTLDITQYIQVDVGGTLYKLAVVTS